MPKKTVPLLDRVIECMILSVVSMLILGAINLARTVYSNSTAIVALNKKITRVHENVKINSNISERIKSNLDDKVRFNESSINDHVIRLYSIEKDIEYMKIDIKTNKEALK